MLAEQHYLRSPLRPFSDLDLLNNNNGTTSTLTMEEKALLAARSQLFLRATAAAVAATSSAGGSGGIPFPGNSMVPQHFMYPRPRGELHPSHPSPLQLQQLWSHWACLNPSSLLAAHSHFAMAAAAAALQANGQNPHHENLRLPRPMYPSLNLASSHRFNPYPLPPLPPSTLSQACPTPLLSSTTPGSGEPLSPTSCSSTPDSCHGDSVNNCDVTSLTSSST